MFCAELFACWNMQELRPAVFKESEILIAEISTEIDDCK
jgi:hypothetical protein